MLGTSRRVAGGSLALLLLFAGTALARANVRTGFDPAVDGLPFTNNGDMNSPDGNCWGMSLMAIDNYLQRQRSGAPGVARPTTIENREGYFEEQGAASWAQASLEELEGDNENPTVGPRDPSQLNAALDRIEATGAPEVMTIQSAEGGHAVVVYGYEDGNLLIYDPNFPGETIRWPFDPKRGVGPHPKGREPGGSFYRRITGVGSTPYAQHRAAARLAEIRRACDANEPVCTDRFPVSTALLERTPGGDVRVTGTVARGPTRDLDGKPTRPVNRAWVYVNGKLVGTTPVNRFGTYRLTVPRGALREGGPNEVRVIMETQRGRRTTYAGARRFSLDEPAPVASRPPAPAPRPAPGGRQPAGRPSRTRGLAGAIQDGE